MIFGKAIFCMAVGYGVDLHKIFAFIVEKQLCNLRLLSSKCSDCGFNLNLSDPCIGIPRDAFECSNLNDLDLPLESNQPHPTINPTNSTTSTAAESQKFKKCLALFELCVLTAQNLYVIERV